MYIQANFQNYPYPDSQLRKDNPQVSFPEILTDEIRSAYGVYPVQPVPPPEYNKTTHRLQEINPIKDGDVWVQTWEVIALTQEELQDAVKGTQQVIVNSVQQRLDDFARTRNYDNILSACTYATSNIPKFAAEGQTAVNLRDATWAALYQILEEVQAGQRETPTGFSDIEHLLPPLEWPV